MIYSIAKTKHIKEISSCFCPKKTFIGIFPQVRFVFAHIYYIGSAYKDSVFYSHRSGHSNFTISPFALTRDAYETGRIEHSSLYEFPYEQMEPDAFA